MNMVCIDCGASLHFTRTFGVYTVQVTSCRECGDKAWGRAYAAGKSEKDQRVSDKAYWDGHDAGKTAGRTEGMSYDEVRAYNEGHTKGWHNARKEFEETTKPAFKAQVDIHPVPSNPLLIEKIEVRLIGTGD